MSKGSSTSGFSFGKLGSQFIANNFVCIQNDINADKVLESLFNLQNTTP